MGSIRIIQCFCNKIFMTELMISDNQNTKFDDRRAKYITERMPEDTKMMAINGMSNYYHSPNMADFIGKLENFDFELIDGYGTVCHQHGILYKSKPSIETTLREETEKFRLQ